MNVFEWIRRHPRTGPYGQEGNMPDQNYKPKKPREPTSTEPGSVERLRVYCRRVDNGEDIFHPEDTKCRDSILGYGYRDGIPICRRGVIQGRITRAGSI